MILASTPVWTGLASAVAVLGYALPALAHRRLNDQATRRLLWLAWLAHALALLGGLVPPQRFGFAPALSVTAWLVLTAYQIERHFYPQLRGRWALGGLGGLVVLIAWLFPGTPLHAQASSWLPLHLALGLSAYGMFAAAIVHAWLMTHAERDIRQAHTTPGLPLLTLERLTFRFVAAGFVLLSATLLLGMLFGGQLYGQAGRTWHWDHKSVFSLLSWLTFAVLLWGRRHRGWRGRRAVRVLYTGAGLLMLSYVGSRFVVEVLLGRTA
ncbi:MAG: cytochrome C assembly protein [Betaproteobacteria bacterium]|nr:cytochrome C assembly protein [Betaproteobacteria bacterium]